MATSNRQKKRNKNQKDEGNSWDAKERRKISSIIKQINHLFLPATSYASRLAYRNLAYPDQVFNLRLEPHDGQAGLLLAESSMHSNSDNNEFQ